MAVIRRCPARPRIRTARHRPGGSLPAGLTLNQDTGGITGVPTAAGARRFTVTARNSGGVADARITYRLMTAAR
ncbi:Ig domain-containing protein [Streptomyces sp. NPDC001880]